MSSALRSFTVAALAALLCLGMAWLVLKSRASGEASKPVPTKFFDELPNFIIAADLTKMATSGTTKNQLPSNVVLFVDVQISRDKKVIVTSETEFDNPNYDENSKDLTPEKQLKRIGTRYLSFADIQKVRPQIRLLESYFADEPFRKFIINVIDYPPGGDTVLSDVITNSHADGRIIFQSTQDGALSDLRKINPMWLFGTSRAQVVQTLWLATIGLEGVAQIKGDVLVSPLYAQESRQKTLLLTSKLISEARRRSMKVLVGPAEPSEFDEIRKLGVDGVITSHPEEFGFPQL